MTTEASVTDLPEHARERLAGMRGQPGRRSFFTSDLTVNEFLLVKEAGFEPLGLVVGTSIYHIGFQSGRIRQNMELEVLTQAMYHARELAMGRMEEEANLLGADGVVGVRLLVGRCSWATNLAEFKISPRPSTMRANWRWSGCSTRGWRAAPPGSWGPTSTRKAIPGIAP